MSSPVRMSQVTEMEKQQLPYPAPRRVIHVAFNTYFLLEEHPGYKNQFF
jgi:hypothetical protein